MSLQSSEERCGVILYKKTYNPCDDCPYSFSKNNQESNTCKICEFKKLLDKYQNDTYTSKERGGEM